MAHERVERWPLTGRDAELDAFNTAWANRRCQAVVIYGPAGVGKTRLAEECLARAIRGGFESGRATATKAASAVPLGAIAHLIPAGVDLSDPAQGFRTVAAELAGPPHKRRQWALWIDDLHLLDAASAVLLHHLMNASAVRLIGTIRAGEPVSEAVALLTHGEAVHRIAVNTINRDQTGALLKAALGGPVGRSALNALYTTSGGNVLYLRELVLGALSAGALSVDGGIWQLTEGSTVRTPRLAELIGNRLAAAGPHARPILELLALCEPISMVDAQQAAPSGTLRALEDAGLIQVITDRRRTTVQLVHPLYGEALRASLPKLRHRMVLLQQVARVAAHGARRRDDSLHIAAWRLAATGTADPETLLQAAAVALHTNDYNQAAALAKAAWREDRSAKAATSYATALIGLVRHEEADQVLREAQELIPNDADRATVFEARLNNIILQGRLLDAQQLLQMRNDSRSRLSLTKVLYFRGRFDDCLECCRPLLDSSDPETAMDAVLFAVSAMLRLGRVDDADEVFEQLRRCASGPGWERKTRKFSLYSEFIEDVDAYAHAVGGNLFTAESLLTRQYDQATARDEMVVAARRATGLGFVLMERGRPRSALDVLHAVATKSTQWELFAQWAQASATICAATLQQVNESERYVTLLPPVGDDIEACNNRVARAWHAYQKFDKPETERLLIEAAEDTKKLKQHLHQVWVVHHMGRLGMAGLAAPYWNVPVQQEFLQARLNYTRAIALKDVKLLTRVAEVFRSAGADLFAAEAYAEVLHFFQSGGQPRQAAAAVKQVADTVALCEGARTPALTYLSTARAAVALTAREREIALLAAAGTASKDIATTLHLSVRTVDNHLQHAYTKLGVTTRRELAVALGATRLNG
ncbi:LuxR C-terminal-related transcriptional regulator [Streptomyces sp. NPDC059688]|uniref:LuxR C-terminal-related transcriptional regulator n=1 Tax=Streptomyces sp. NPDC059688 TaxID=3346906 RepID=UPI0036A8C05B